MVAKCLICRNRVPFRSTAQPDMRTLLKWFVSMGNHAGLSKEPPLFGYTEHGCNQTFLPVRLICCIWYACHAMMDVGNLRPAHLTI